MTEPYNRALQRSEPPQTEPLSLAEAKLYLRIDGDAEDALITDLMVVVRDAAEEYLGKSLVSQSWLLRYESYVPAVVPLPKGPVQHITKVMAVDRAGAEQTVPESRYHLAGNRMALHFDSIIMAQEVHIHYAAGYGDAEDVPATIRQGMLMHLAALHEDRLGSIGLPAAVVALYKSFRTMRMQ